jgi:hypothetical protein
VGGLLRACIRWVERRSFANCDRLIFLSHSMAERAIRDYDLRRDICSVHYPFQTLPTHKTKITSTLEQTLPATCLNVVYSGALGDKQSPDELLRFMVDVQRRYSNAQCHIFSAGPHFERLKHAFQGRVDCYVNFHPLVDEEELGELYARSAVQIIPQAGGTADGALPSKLPNLLAAGVPVFAICDEDSEVARILAAAGAGLTAAGFSSTETMQRFDAFIAHVTADSRATRIERLRPFVEQHFGVDRVVEEILRDGG